MENLLPLIQSELESQTDLLHKIAVGVLIIAILFVVDHIIKKGDLL